MGKNCGDSRKCAAYATASMRMRSVGSTLAEEAVKRARMPSSRALARAVTFAPAVLTWTDARQPEGKSPLSPRAGRGDTSFCVLQRNGSWATVAYSADAGEYAPSGACVPPATSAGPR